MRKELLLLFLAIIIIFSPLFFSLNLLKTEEPFSGADEIAERKIQEINKDYKPWFEPIFEPPSGEVESLFFSLQSGIGGIIIGYIVGRYRKIGS
jgi:cobalt/nickel transport protein